MQFLIIRKVIGSFYTAGKAGIPQDLVIFLRQMQSPLSHCQSVLFLHAPWSYCGSFSRKKYQGQMKGTEESSSIFVGTVSILCKHFGLSVCGGGW